MKKLKVAILVIAVIIGVSDAIASKAKRGGQYFYLRPGESSTGLSPVKTAIDQSAPLAFPVLQATIFTFVAL